MTDHRQYAPATVRNPKDFWSTETDAARADFLVERRGFKLMVIVA
jgi:hypothetical protein